MLNRLRELRTERGWSQAHLAELLEVSRRSVNAIETGRYDPSLPLAFRLARLFELSIEAIFQVGDDPSRRSRGRRRPWSRVSLLASNGDEIVFLSAR